MGWFTRNDVPLPMLAAVLASALLAPLQASALEAGSMHRLSEDELRRVAAQGLSDRFLQRIALYAAHGLGIEVFGNTASLLNRNDDVFIGLIDGDVTFRDAKFNPANPTGLVGPDGSALVRLPATIGELNVRNLRIRGSNGTTFGSVSIRDIDTGGTTIRITPH